MAEELFPHLFLAGPTTTQGFTSAWGGGDPAELPSRDRAAHAAMLEQRLDIAWASAMTRQAAVHSSRRGCYLEFVSAPGKELALKSLEFMPSGVRLVNVRSRGSGASLQTLATVFVPKEKRHHFFKRIKDYADVTKKSPSGNPVHQPLVASIEDVAAALLQDFWTDKLTLLPGDTPIWAEIWLTTEDNEKIESFRRLLVDNSIQEHKDRPLLRFPERAILLVLANGPQLTLLIELSDLIAEFRKAKEVSSFFSNLENRDQAAWCQNLVDRLNLQDLGNVSVCILDQGINRGHPLILPLLAAEDLHAYDPDWGTSDHGGHGTLMAGLAGYGDLHGALEASVEIPLRHRLESVKILPPPPAKNPQHLWGHVTAQGISRAEIQSPTRKRIICLAVTATETREAGHPTSWSAELDALAAGVDDSNKRLLVVSSGNVVENWEHYHSENLTNEVHDPAQAWNALSVGACTFKTQIADTDYADYQPVAQLGELSPFSTTSHLWEHERWPIKPEIVVEGGNVAKGPGGEVADIEDLRLISTSHDITRNHFWPFEATSAASAQVAWMAAQIQSYYPEAWPETIRGLLVHSASWTPGLLDQFPVGWGKSSYRTLLRVCGYGVPDLAKALTCVKSTLTLVAEHEIQPFVNREDKARATNEMHLYKLPWPETELLGLGELPVKMRVTLSYFVEPGPGEVGWSHRYRYASYGLRFELNSPGESQSEFTKRINKQARDEEEGKPVTESPNQHWTLGQQRNVGSIHSDIWTGRAADLATSNLIAVRPVVGWWRERHHLGKVESKTRYSLIVSIETPSQETDIYTPVAIKLGIAVPVPIEVPISYA